MYIDDKLTGSSGPSNRLMSVHVFWASVQQAKNPTLIRSTIRASPRRTAAVRLRATSRSFMHCRLRPGAVLAQPAAVSTRGLVCLASPEGARSRLYGF